MGVPLNPPSASTDAYERRRLASRRLARAAATRGPPRQVQWLSAEHECCSRFQPARLAQLRDSFAKFGRESCHHDGRRSLAGKAAAGIEQRLQLYGRRLDRSHDGGTDKAGDNDLRHVANTMAASTGAGLRELMYRMGHASPDAARRYQHATQERDAAIAQALGALIGAAPPSAERAAVTELPSGQ